jgi:DNA-binding response OmpR family regulator
MVGPAAVEIGREDRRAWGESGSGLGKLEIDSLDRWVRVGASELCLTPLEQNLLYLLAANAGRLLTWETVLLHPPAEPGCSG